MGQFWAFRDGFPRLGSRVVPGLLFKIDNYYCYLYCYIYIYIYV